MSRDVLRQHTLMAHLLEALEAKQDIGPYGRLVLRWSHGISYLKAN